MSSESLDRFIDAQKNDYAIALREIQNGRKQSHWMWYIFPQIKGLGISSTSKFYAIKNGDEALAYLLHPILGSRLITISQTLLTLKSTNPTSIFGSPDDVKLQSSMTLFAAQPNADPVFKNVLEKYFDGKIDSNTIRLLGT